MKVVVKGIVHKTDSRDCSYPLDPIVIPGRISHTVIVEYVLQKLERWLSPPDPSKNYNIGLRELHDETATSFLEVVSFRNGIRLVPCYGITENVCSWKRRIHSSLMTIHSGLREGHPLVRHFYSLSLHGDLTFSTSSAIVQRILSLSKGGKAFVGYFYFYF